ncbi:MAG TPA: TM2 domain-containing protein [Acidisarcina sp.]
MGVRGRSGKSGTAALFLSLFGGFLGLDMFYLDRMWLGILKLVTVGGYGVWWLVDVIRLCRGRMRDGDGGMVERPFT